MLIEVKKGPNCTLTDDELRKELKDNGFDIKKIKISTNNYSKK